MIGRANGLIYCNINMPVMNGIEATRVLTKEMPAVKVIALSMHLETGAVTGIREAVLQIHSARCSEAGGLRVSRRASD